MDTKSRQQKRQDAVLLSLNAAIEALNLAKEASSMTPATAAFGSVSILLTMIRDSMTNKSDYVELGLACAGVCKALDRGMNGRQPDELNRSVCQAIRELTATVEEIQENIVEKNGRNLFSRLVYAKKDKDVMTGWRSDLNRILQVFNTELAINNHLMLLDIHRNVPTGQGGTNNQHRTTQARSVISKTVEFHSPTLHSVPVGELPPPPQRACFGRDELIEKVVGLAESLKPVALIGAGGIGKTSVALAVLHHDRIKERFGDNRRFIRCDEFPASRANFLSRLSKAIGANIENFKDLTPLRRYLSSREMMVILDNAESILDPHGKSTQEIFAVVEELSQLSNICLCITSRITTVPPDCKRLDVPGLSLDAARRAFYHIYDNDERPDLIDNVLKRLDFHPLSVVLLATVGRHNRWDTDRLTREWEQHRTGVLQTEHNKSLVATIELSLYSPMFQQLGSDARDLLGVVAFFPQGIDEDNLDWLFSTRIPFSRVFSAILGLRFPTTSERKNAFDKFCVLSLTYRSNGFITMLAPLRDYLYPKRPDLSPLLRSVKKRYFRRLSVPVGPSRPGFKETRWMIPEDTNIEHLLDVFTSIDPSSVDVWNACNHFMEHLLWHKPRVVVLEPKIEGLPDDHPSKPECLVYLSRLFGSVGVGNQVECKRILTHALKLWGERGSDLWVARTLRHLSSANRKLDLPEGIAQAEEASDIFERLGYTAEQAECLRYLGRLLCNNNQLDAAEAAASRAIDLVSAKHDQCRVCTSHRVLGEIYQSRGEREKATHQFRTVLEIASPLDWHDELFWGHYNLAGLACDEGKLDDAYAHIERSKSHAVNNAYYLGRAMELQAWVWYKPGRLEEARSEALRAVDVYEKLGAAGDLKRCRKLLQKIQKELDGPISSDESDFSGRSRRQYPYQHHPRVFPRRVLPVTTDPASERISHP